MRVPKADILVIQLHGVIKVIGLKSLELFVVIVMVSLY